VENQETGRFTTSRKVKHETKKRYLFPEEKSALTAPTSPSPSPYQTARAAWKSLPESGSTRLGDDQPDD
jgi:hypothetical protein